MYTVVTICVSERGTVYPTYSVFMFQILCVRQRKTVTYLKYVYVPDFVYQKRVTVSYLQYVYVLDFVYKKDGNCIIPTVCLCSRLCESDSQKLHHTYSISMLQILCIRKWETASYPQFCYVLDFVYQTYSIFIFQILCTRKSEAVSCLQYVYFLDFVYQKERNCIIPTICLFSRFSTQR